MNKRSTKKSKPKHKATEAKRKKKQSIDFVQVNQSERLANPDINTRRKYTFKILRRVETKRKVRNKTKKTYKFVEIKATDFKANQYVRIFVVHRETKQKRLLAFGKFKHLPIYGTNKATPNFNRLLGGRYFEPTKGKVSKRGNWVPTDQIVNSLEREVQQFAKDQQVDARGIMIPPRNYYHTKWLVYSDKPITGTKKYKKIAVQFVLTFAYPKEQWVGKRSIVIDLDPPLKVKDFANNVDKLEEDVQLQLMFNFPQTYDLMQVLAINGFIPLEEAKTRKRKKK